MEMRGKCQISTRNDFFSVMGFWVIIILIAPRECNTKSLKLRWRSKLPEFSFTMPPDSRLELEILLLSDSNENSW